MTYSLDLINRVINFYNTTSHSLRYVEQIFAVSKSVIANWIKELPITYKNITNITPKIKDQYISFIKKSLNHNPFQTQKQLQEKLSSKFNIDVSSHLIRTILKTINYTKKKVSRKLYNADLKAHKLNRKEFKKKIKNINKDDIICIDEVGVNKTISNDYGYCHKSKRLQYFVDTKQIPQKRSIIVAINNKKVVH